MLVAVNAAADNADLSMPPNALGVQHAKQLISCLSDPSTGIGVALANKLQNDVTMDNSFSGLATLAATRMLNAGSSAIGTVSADKDVSRMSRGQASNVIFPSNVLPSEFSFVDPNFSKSYSTTTVAASNNQYLAGYEPITIPGVTDAKTVLVGVSLHPMQNPHLVGSSDFNANKTPIAGISQTATNAVPPNSFKSGGMAEELKSAKILQTISCAVVGTVNPSGQFTASIPNGYMVVANGNSSGTLTPPSSAASETLPGPIVMDQYASGLVDSAYGGGTQDIFSDVLMANTVYVTPNGAMSEQVGTIQAIIDWKNTQIQAGLPTTPVPANLANAIDGPNPKQSSADGIDPAQSYVACTNNNSAPEVINPRPGGGPADSKLATLNGGGMNANQPLPGNGVCTGMMAQPLASIPPTAAIDFGATPTIAALIGPNSTFTSYSKTAGNATTIYNQFKQRLYQIDVSQVPSWINTQAVEPDGSTLVADTGSINLIGTFVDISGEAVFPIRGIAKVALGREAKLFGLALRDTMALSVFLDSPSAQPMKEQNGAAHANDMIGPATADKDYAHEKLTAFIDLPDVPRYSGAGAIFIDGLKYPNDNFGQDITMTFGVMEQAQQVNDWYKAALQQYQWTIYPVKSDPSMRDSYSIDAGKGKYNINLIVRTVAGQPYRTRVVVRYKFGK
ncbi:unnamed protein product [Sphagnum balticum]